MNVLERAAEIVDGARERDYGHPDVNHSCTAAMVEAYLPGADMFGRVDYVGLDPRGLPHVFVGIALEMRVCAARATCPPLQLSGG